MTNIDQYNPYKFFREGQKDCINNIIDSYQSGNKIIELNAPTASGKTLCLYTVGRILEKEFNIKKVAFTSPQVALIETGNLFGLPKLVGKRNYKCNAIKGYTAEDCPFSSKKEGFQACEKCSYRIAKQLYKSQDFGAVTFARYNVDPSIYMETKALFIDESSELEHLLLDKSTIELDLPLKDITKSKKPADQLSELRKYLKTFDVSLYLKNRQSELEINTKRLSKQCIDYRKTIFEDDKRRPASSEMKRLRSIQMDYNGFRRKFVACNNALRYLNSDAPHVLTADLEEVWQPELRRKTTLPVPYFKLLNAYLPFADLVSNLDIVVLASGTPTTDFVTKKYKSIVVKHPISVERRLIHYDPVGSMSYENRIQTSYKMAKRIQQLHDTYSKHTIVHCGSYYIAELLAEHLSGNHVVKQDPEWREESLREWQKMDEGIFLSVRYEEGISLDGPEYPMNIIAKVPFPFFGDEWVTARNKLDNKYWYNLTTAMLIQQACGRTTRGPDDFSETHILDSSFSSLYYRSKSLFMPWFKAALVWKS